jgi:hypothetical protein
MMVLKADHKRCAYYTMIVHFVLVVRIDLDQTVYEVVEDAGSVEVCATLSDSGPGIERNLMVFLIISEDTAQGNFWDIFSFTIQ